MSRTFSHSNAKLVVSVFARGSASMRRTCCSSTLGSLSLPCSASVEQFVVGNAAPQEERQARREFETVQLVDAAGLRVRRAAARRDTGTSRSTASRPVAFSMPPSNVAGLAAFAVELHQRREILVGHRTPEAFLARFDRMREAQAVSSFGSGARHTKMRARLGVSTGLPVGLNGPSTVTIGRAAAAPRAATADHAADHRARAGVAGSGRTGNESEQLAFALGEAAAGVRRDDRCESRRQMSAAFRVHCAPSTVNTAGLPVRAEFIVAFEGRQELRGDAAASAGRQRHVRRRRRAASSSLLCRRAECRSPAWPRRAPP